MKKIFKNILFILIMIAFMEGVLNVFDIWGVHYFDDLAYIWSNVRDTDKLYYLPKGNYYFNHWLFNSWQATMIEDGQRYTPSSTGNCKIVFVGDSVTFGHGIDDNKTWVNILASKMPQISTINIAMNGYNSEHVLNSLKVVPDAAAYIYIIVPNDTEPTSPHPVPTYMSMMEKYVRFSMLQWGGSKVQASGKEEGNTSVLRFKNDVQLLSNNKKVLMIGIDDPVIKELTKGLNIIGWVSYPKNTRISNVDAHPNIEGHKILSEQIYALIKDKVEKVCNE